MSCNGCRVLRKGCSDSCVLRQCLKWIESPDAQGHATVFVAKFFGRAGMMALISSVPESQRPALFQSLLYESCGRTVNPVFGAVGLLCSGNWKLCQDAVETVMRGGLLSNSSSGTGRPGAVFNPSGVSPVAAAGFRLPRVRMGRVGGGGSSTKPPMVKEELLEEESDEAHRKSTSRNVGVKRKAMAMAPKEYDRFVDEGEEEEDKKQLKVEGAGKLSACRDEGPGLDLTLGSNVMSCSPSSTPTWGRGHQRITPSTTMEVKPEQLATSGPNRRRSSSPASCHSSSEADSDTTDLSISIIQQHCQAPFPDRSSMSRDLLLDLLH